MVNHTPKAQDDIGFPEQDPDGGDTFVEALENIARMATMSDRIRPPEQIGSVLLSVQASSSHHCHPRVDDLPVEEYELVEVGLLGVPSRGLKAPSAFGLDERFDRFFQTCARPVAPRVTHDFVAKLRAALQRRAGKDDA